MSVRTVRTCAVGMRDAPAIAYQKSSHEESSRYHVIIVSYHITIRECNDDTVQCILEGKRTHSASSSYSSSQSNGSCCVMSCCIKLLLDWIAFVFSTIPSSS
mmetsp:Transcript_27941/g.31289  ORF Transcript_27941/g.31289 Transcript_27941/m.31289 type:complete len:102 (-) Transcript_27941:30-335(-)